ncbi:hypothetical protein FQZ97_968320 [compost metagenome]
MRARGRLLVYFSAFEIRLNSTTRSMARSPATTGRSAMRQSMSLPAASGASSRITSVTRAFRSTGVLRMAWRPMREKASRSSISVLMRRAASAMVVM